MQLEVRKCSLSIQLWAISFHLLSLVFTIAHNDGRNVENLIIGSVPYSRFTQHSVFEVYLPPLYTARSVFEVCLTPVLHSTVYLKGAFPRFTQNNSRFLHISVTDLNPIIL
jgi:hypothetical protein